MVGRRFGFSLHRARGSRAWGAVLGILTLLVPMSLAAPNVAFAACSLSVMATSVTTVEGASFTGQVAAITDSGSTQAASTYSATITWGDGTGQSTGSVSGSSGSYTVSSPHTFADEGTFPINVSVTRSDAGCGSSTTASSSSTATVTEGDNLTAGPAPTLTTTEYATFSGVVGTFTDSITTNNAGDFAATIGWGDSASSAGTITGAGGSYTVSGSHMYADEGTFPVVVTFMEDSAGTAKATLNATMTVAEGDSFSVTGKAVTMVVNQQFTGIVGTMTVSPNLNAANSFDISINWGDGGAPSTGTLSANSATSVDISGSHTYSSTGNKGITITVKDVGGLTVTGSATATVTGSSSGSPSTTPPSTSPPSTTPPTGPAGGTPGGSGGPAVTTSGGGSGAPAGSTTDPTLRWIQHVTQDVLGRAPTDQEIAMVTQLLASGTSRNDLALALLGSQEAQVALITMDYQTFLGRLPGPDEIATLTSFPWTDEQLAGSIMASPEYYGLAGGSNTTFVNKVYMDLLHRPADATGLSDLTAYLDGGGDPGQMLAGLMSSPEYDQNVVQAAYGRFLRHPADDAGLANAVMALQAGATDEQVQASLISSDEYFNMM